MFNVVENYGKVFFVFDMLCYLLNLVFIIVFIVIGCVIFSFMIGFVLGVYKFCLNFWVFFMFVVGNFVLF